MNLKFEKGSIGISNSDHCFDSSIWLRYLNTSLICDGELKGNKQFLLFDLNINLGIRRIPHAIRVRMNAPQLIVNKTTEAERNNRTDWREMWQPRYK